MKAKFILCFLAISFILLVLLLPLAAIFMEAFSKGLETFWLALVDPDALAALRLTLITAFFAVSFNLLFGLSAAWCISKYEFRGKSLLLSLIDLPLAISPVVVGMIFILLYGKHGAFGGLIQTLNFNIIFAVPGIILVTTFISSPLIIRELLPLMQEQGNEEEEAALTLGASGLQTFISITLPKIKWALLYGVILCNARAMGEFGAVSVVSGHIRGETNTLPLHVEVLYNEYEYVASFAVSALLACLAIVTLVVKSVLESTLKGEKAN